MAVRSLIGWRALKAIADHLAASGYATDFFLYGLSQEVIRLVLRASLEEGRISDSTAKAVTEWLVKHIHEGDHSTRFLRSAPVLNYENGNLHLLRVRELAELLFNLQGVPNIHSLIFRRIFDDPQNLEATVLELEGMRLLNWARLPFLLNVPGKTKFNYECDIKLTESVTAFCEMKCKLEGTEPSKGAIVGPLGHARGQLPENGCGIVIIKLPMQWPIGGGTSEVINDAVDGVLRNTTRIANVVLYRHHFLLTEQHAATSISVKEIPNKRSPFYEMVKAGIFKDVANPLSTSWLHFVWLNNYESFKETYDRYHQGLKTK